MTFLRRDATSLLALLAAVAVSLLSYPWLPLRVPVHWGINGRVDDYAHRDVAAALNPAAMLLAYIFFTFIRYADRGRVSRLVEIGLYEPIRHSAVCFFGYFHAMAIGSGLGWIREDANLLTGTVAFLVLMAGLYSRVLPEALLDAPLRLLGVPSTRSSRADGSRVLAASGLGGLLGTCAGSHFWLLGVVAAAGGGEILRRRHHHGA